MTKRRIEWDDVKHDYVMGIRKHKGGIGYIYYPTLNDLAEKYDISMSAVAVKSRNEKWVLQREMFKEKVANYREQSLSEYKIRSSTQFDSENVLMLEKISMILKARLAMYNELYNDNLEEVMASGDYNIPGIKEVNETLDAIGKLHITMRNVIGEPLNYYEAAKETNREIQQAKQTVKVDEVKDLISTVRKELDAKTVDVEATTEDEE